MAAHESFLRIHLLLAILCLAHQIAESIMVIAVSTAGEGPAGSDEINIIFSLKHGQLLPEMEAGCLQGG